MSRFPTGEAAEALIGRIKNDNDFISSLTKGQVLEAILAHHNEATPGQVQSSYISYVTSPRIDPSEVGPGTAVEQSKDTVGISHAAKLSLEEFERTKPLSTLDKVLNSSGLNLAAAVIKDEKGNEATPLLASTVKENSPEEMPKLSSGVLLADANPSIASVGNLSAGTVRGADKTQEKFQQKNTEEGIT